MSQKATQRSVKDQELTAAMDRLLEQIGADSDSTRAKRVREIMHTAVKLVQDEADLGEVKLLSRSIKEMRYALKVFREYRDVRKVSIFGSARTVEGHPDYQAAVDFSRVIARAKWMVITGAGDGIMRAGHGGAGRDASFGVAIRLPFETTANDVIIGDEKLITFRYFFTRKLMFMWQAHAVVLFPGGFGTQDEGYEALTLIQTGKAPLVPVVMVDHPGGSYWKNWQRYVNDELLAYGMISEEDLALFHVTDDPQEAAHHVLHFYRNYHSQRFVQDTLVLRMLRPLTDAQLEQINEEFADLVTDGRIEQGGALAGEKQHMALPRLKLLFTKRDYGRLRMLIDRINDYDVQNTPEPDEAWNTQPPYTDLADETPRS